MELEQPKRCIDIDPNRHNAGIDKFYYYCIIPFYKKLYTTPREALHQNEEILLWQVAEVCKCKVIFRSQIMSYILS